MRIVLWVLAAVGALALLSGLVHLVAHLVVPLALGAAVIGGGIYLARRAGRSNRGLPGRDLPGRERPRVR